MTLTQLLNAPNYGLDLPAVNGSKGAGGVDGSAFAEQLEGAIDSVDDLQISADNALADLASGRSVDIHGTMIELEKADISMRTLVAVRNKAVAAYEQIMNMAV